MKFTIKKATKAFPFLLILIMIFAIFFSLFYCCIIASAKSNSSAIFVKKYQTLTVDKQVQYKVKNLKKTDYVRFFVSNTSHASIEKKSGWLTTKKSGKVTITAKIYNKKNKKIKTLKNTILILKKKNILPNATFKVKENINPYDFTLSLSCNRILLKKEIASDKLTILPKGKSAPLLTASFTKLSADGKEVIYTLSSSSQKKLCPGDFSMDGSYILESTCFSKKLSLSYEERLTQNTLSGFILKEDGNPIKNALLSLKRNKLATKTCYSDENGYYKLKNISNAISLTVEKEGYQKKTIYNPVISSKGMTCENVILRSSEETSAAIKFLITDTENKPISDASISIEFNKNVKAENASYFTNKEDILYSGTTDSNGTLLLANSKALSAAPCSNLTLYQKSTLSYTTSARLSSTNTAILPTSILNTSDNYTIYVSKFSPDNLSSVYQTQKLEFSFYDLITSQANIHIQLKKCPNVTINNLTLNYKNSLSHCHKISLQFFHPQQKSAFYEYSIPREQFIQKENEINISLPLPFALPDGTYYLSAHAISEDKFTIAESVILPVTLQNSTLLSQTITLQQPRFARALIYGDSDNITPSKSSFHLYQKCNNYYFLIDTFDSENFTKNNSDYITSTLLLSHLLPEQDYLLLSAEESIFIKDIVSISTTEKNTYLSKDAAKYSISPINKIHCILADKNNYSAVPNDFYNTSIPINYHICHTISQDFIRSSKSYPNSVIVFYHTNGTLLSLNLTIPPVNQEVINSTNKTNAITDIYTNKEILITNQDSYTKY